MACGEDDGDAAVFVALGVENTADALFGSGTLDEEVGDMGREVVFAAMSEDGVAHVGDDAAEAVGAYMGVGVDGDGGVGTVFDEALDDIGGVATLGAAGVEFAVGVGSGTAFAEAPVAFGVDLTGAAEKGDVEGALLDGLTAFDNDGSEAAFESPQGSEQSGRTGTDDDDGWFGAAVLIAAAVVGGDERFVAV